MTQVEYVPRILEKRLASLLDELPALMVVGPRASGKTTMLERYAATTVRLDREAEASAFKADPDVALRNLPEPVLLDEWQEVPAVLGAVKRAVDADSRGGRFLLAGSVVADLEAATWPGTGRVVRLEMFGCTQRELELRSDRPSLLDGIRRDGLAAIPEVVDSPPDLRGYLDRGLRSGFPEPALRLSQPAGRAWLDGYLDQIVTRDLNHIDRGRDPDRIRRFMTAAASLTAQVVDDKTLYEAAGIDRRTAVAYEQLLKNLFVVEWAPSWSTNLLKQLVQMPKRLFCDVALAAALLRLDADLFMRRGEMLGPFLETFVATQLRTEVAASANGARIHHVRTAAGRHEVDFVVDFGAAGLLAIEVKATSSPRAADAKHLRWFADSLGDRVIGSLVLHTGPRIFELAPGVIAAPIAVLWNT